MNRFIAAAVVGLLAATFAFDADAQRRLGGGRSLGRQSPQVQQRQAAPAQQAPQQAAPAQPAPAGQQQAAPAGPQGAAAPAAASPWRGALLGLAAGLGLAALASHFGFSETLTAILMAALLGFGLMLVLAFVLRRSRGDSPQPAYGDARGGSAVAYGPEAQPAPVPAPLQRSALDLAAQARPGSAMDEFARAGAGDAPWGVPPGFDKEGFLANAKSYFRKLQRAWDRGDLHELQEFTTEEMFAALMHERRAQTTHSKSEVRTLEATLLGIETSATDYLASVRFSGVLQADEESEQVDEVWNLSKPVDGKSGWLLAGIQQLS